STQHGLARLDATRSDSRSIDSAAVAPVAPISSLPETTGSIAVTPEASSAEPVPPPDATDDLVVAKRQFRASNYGLPEQHFRRAVEKAPQGSARDAEAWLGLAASYDRLRRFELADRAYSQALRIVGPTPELLNNYGYSYLLRGDYRRARAKLMLAHDKD